jgi:hypothetical protein
MCTGFIRDQKRWHGSGIFAVVLTVLLSVLPGGGLLAAGSKPSATVEIQQTQIAFIGSGNLGGGKLFFSGKTYKFTIGGLGIGGIGITTMTATGNVYNLKEVSQFAGTYAQGRAGITVGSSDNGGLWLQNEAGVVMQLKAKREGVALSLGGDAIYIDFEH